MSIRNPQRSQSGTTQLAPWSRSDLLIAISLVAGTLLVYSQVWQFGFIDVDDPAYVPGNPFVQEGLTLRSVTWSLTAVHDCNWIPLTWLSLMVDSAAFGRRPGGYHLTNVLLHAASSVVLFAALTRATGRRARSAFVAALFALHPLHVESVARVAERKDVLSTLFGLLSLLAYIRYAATRRWRNYLVSLALFVGSLLSKQALVTLPFVFLLLDYWPLGRFSFANDPAPARAARRPNKGQSSEPRRVDPRLITEKIPFLAVAAAFSLIALATQSSGGAMAIRFPFAARVRNAVVVYVAYLEKALYPQNLAFYYPHPGVGLSWILVAVSAILLLAITAVAIAWVRRFPFLFVGWFWYLGTLVPTIGLVQIGIQQMADRYTYFPLIGIFIAFTWIIPEFVPVGALRTRVLPLAAFGGLLLLASTTFSQVSYWHDSVTRLRHSLDSTRESSHAHELLGAALLDEGAVRDGVEELEKAVKTAAPYAPLHYELGSGYERLGRLDDALKQYQEAILIDERLPEVHNRIGAILTERRQFSEAKRYLDRALQIDDDSAATHANLSLLLLKMDQNSEAIAHAKRALALNPELLVCHQYLALAMRAQGHFDDAIDELQKLVVVSPGDQSAREELAR